jgi:hypothetical protein
MKLLLAAAAIAVLVGAGLCSEVIIFNTLRRWPNRAELH